ncbi:ABC transporter permease [Haloarcula salinisoli]|uniref:ABC transporter permease n=1 Tax=Haloarcula salinisoli TaxID=2487746 RepID=A0A8J7YBQ9_9EURY|nr:ABC transporter permease subunit [Halomicroarcula salinisoli]MBX0285894.1 ABC transporter permease [Halomicroarcula salinisoli]MBX0302612.1 ABC transporter permease [Halomicroarcula salinisoli]
MTLRDITRKDFTAARRSRGLWAVMTLLGLLTTLIAFGFSGYRLGPEETVVRLFRTMGGVFGLLLPIVALVASYMAIAGERESGGVKFLLGLPNSRRDVFLGKLASRLGVVTIGIAFMFATATAMAVARNGALPVGVVVGMFAVSLLYAAVFVAVAVSLSAIVAERSRAIAAAVGSYFLLVMLYVIPGVSVALLVRFVHQTLLGFEPNVDLYNAVLYTSPLIAYRKAMNLVVPTDVERQVLQQPPDYTLPGYLGDELSLVVFAVWLAVPLALGYWRFEGADL